MPFLPPNLQRQRTEGTINVLLTYLLNGAASETVKTTHLMTTLLYADEILIEVSVNALQLQYETGIALLERHCVLLTM